MGQGVHAGTLSGGNARRRNTQYMGRGIELTRQEVNRDEVIFETLRGEKTKIVVRDDGSVMYIW